MDNLLFAIAFGIAAVICWAVADILAEDHKDRKFRKTNKRIARELSAEGYSRSQYGFHIQSMSPPGSTTVIMDHPSVPACSGTVDVGSYAQMGCDVSPTPSP